MTQFTSPALQTCSINKSHRDSSPQPPLPGNELFPQSALSCNSSYRDFSQLGDLSNCSVASLTRINARVRNRECYLPGNIRKATISNAKQLVESAVTVLQARWQVGPLQVTKWCGVLFFFTWEHITISNVTCENCLTGTCSRSDLEKRKVLFFPPLPLIISMI